METVKNKKLDTHSTMEIFSERTPRCILTLKENTYFQEIKIPLEKRTKLFFEILIPAGIGSSFKKAYEDHELDLSYDLHASARVNDKMVKNRKRVYIANYPFTSVDWFQADATSVDKEIQICKKKTEEQSHCCCLSKEVEVERTEDLRVAIEYVPTVMVGTTAECNVRFSSVGFKEEDGRLVLKIAEVVVIEEGGKTIVNDVDCKDILEVNENMKFEFNIKELPRYDFCYTGNLFSRKYAIVLTYKDSQTDFEIIGDLTILSKNNYNIAKSIKEGTLLERKAFDLLEDVSYENESV